MAHCLEDLDQSVLVIVRHGETDWNTKSLIQGHQDIPLNENGKKQALELAQKLQKHQFSAVYSSDLSRAKETAEIINQQHLLTINLSTQLRERYFGEFEGVSFRDVSKDSEGGWTLPTVESNRDLESRISKFLLSAVNQHPGQRLLVVTHGGVMHAIFSYAQLAARDKVKIGNTGFVQLSYRQGKFHLEQSEGIEISH